MDPAQTTIYFATQREICLARRGTAVTLSASRLRAVAQYSS